MSQGLKHMVQYSTAVESSTNANATRGTCSALCGVKKEEEHGETVAGR